MRSKELIYWSGEKLCLRAVEGLKRRGFKAKYFPKVGEAVEYILREAAAVSSIGCGGSLSLEEAGVFEAIGKLGKKVMNHNVADLSPDEKMAVRRGQLTCDLFLSGLNALTVDGEIVNVDGVGNRVAAMIFGPKEVILLAGRNKIVEGGVGEALERIKNIAAPMNAARLDAKTPCIVSGKCEGCRTQNNICRVTTIISLPPKNSDMRILVVNEDLGL